MLTKNTQIDSVNLSLKTSYQLSVKEADIRLLLSNQLSHLDSIAVSVFVVILVEFV